MLSWLTREAPRGGSGPRSALLWAALVGITLLVALFRFAGTRWVSYDDAFIVLVYAKHLLGSGRFYWNASDGNLDGFTSLLDVVLKALASAINPRDRLAAAWYLNLAVYLGVPLMGMKLVASIQERFEGWRHLWAPALAGLALAGNESLAISAASLLEGPIFLMVALTCLWLLLRDRVSLGFLLLMFCLLPLARPEGTVLGVLFGTWHLIMSREEGLARRFRPLGIFILFVALFVAWRIHVFGSWAPNTYYAKTSASRWNELKDGLAYTWTYAQSAQGGLICGALALLPLIGFVSKWQSRRTQLRFALLVLSAFVMTALVIWTGGDSYPGSRFMVMTGALTIVALSTATAGMVGRWRAAPVLLIAAILVAEFGADASRWEAKLAAAKFWPASEKHCVCDRWLAETLSPLFPGQTIAQSDFQGFKYFADEAQVIDLHGLNDRAIAHQPWAGPVRWGKFRIADGLARRPAVWFFGFRIGTTDAAHTSQGGMRQALTDPAIYESSYGFTTTGQELEALVESYRPATMTCGKQIYNFLVEKTQAPRLGALGLPIGGP